MYRLSSLKKGFTLVEIMIVVAIIGILIGIAVPGFMNARSQSRSKACMESQEKMDGAVQEWALENNSDAAPTDYAAIVGANLYLTRTPFCPNTGNAIIIPPDLDTAAECSSDEPTHDRDTLDD